MPTNETGYTLTVGPDAEGKHFEVAPGEDYKLPAPPTTVTDLELAAAAEKAEVGYSALKVAALRELLDSRGLDTTGKQAELVQRLVDADAAVHDPQTPPGDGGQQDDPSATSDGNPADSTEGASA